MNSLVEVDLSTDRPRDYFVEEKGGVIRVALRAPQGKALRST